MSTLKAARADNFYYDPNFNPKKHKSLNDYNRKKKQEKLKVKYGPNYRSDKKRPEEGAHKVRFEVPFHVKCLRCQTMIAKGVRFNAVKKPGKL